jgi:hypothetical protein
MDGKCDVRTFRSASRVLRFWTFTMPWFGDYSSRQRLTSCAALQSGSQTAHSKSGLPFVYRCITHCFADIERL